VDRNEPTMTASGASTSTFLMLVDSRTPTGGYAHSGGIEAAVSDGRVTEVATLAAYVEGRLFSNGLCDASLAAAACAGVGPAAVLCAEAAARCPSPALRAASRAEGRGLLRVARSMWPSSSIDELVEAAGAAGPMWSIALGTVAGAAGLSVLQASTAAAYSSISGPAWAAVRLLGIDPYGVAGMLATLATSVDGVARRAVELAQRASSLRELPAPATPLQEIAAEARERWEVRLFVS
jgi:urease accessory protein